MSRCDLALTPDEYCPSQTAEGEYIDRLPVSNPRIPGYTCPCKANSVSYTRSQLRGHLKTKTHVRWLDNMNANRHNHLRQYLEAQQEATSLRRVIAGLQQRYDVVNNKLAAADRMYGKMLKSRDAKIIELEAEIYTLTMESLVETPITPGPFETEADVEKKPELRPPGAETMQEGMVVGDLIEFGSPSAEGSEGAEAAGGERDYRGVLQAGYGPMHTEDGATSTAGGGEARVPEGQPIWPPAGWTANHQGDASTAGEDGAFAAPGASAAGSGCRFVVDGARIGLAERRQRSDRKGTQSQVE